MSVYKCVASVFLSVLVFVSWEHPNATVTTATVHSTSSYTT